MDTKTHLSALQRERSGQMGMYFKLAPGRGYMQSEFEYELKPPIDYVDVFNDLDDLLRKQPWWSVLEKGVHTMR